VTRGFVSCRDLLIVDSRERNELKLNRQITYPRGQWVATQYIRSVTQLHNLEGSHPLLVAKAQEQLCCGLLDLLLLSETHLIRPSQIVPQRVRVSGPRICSSFLSPSDSSCDEDKRHWRTYGIGCAAKNSHIKGVAEISIVGFPIRGSTASPPGQACSPPMMLYSSMADLPVQGA
jgi:hypothetical protein